jgi:hypothetical protein
MATKGSSSPPPRRSQRCRSAASWAPSWTTDAPFRETAEAIETARAKGVLAVEMEASALYTFAWAKHVSVLCLAHVTNTMGQAAIDFEKGRGGRDSQRPRSRATRDSVGRIGIVATDLKVCVGRLTRLRRRFAEKQAP